MPATRRKKPFSKGRKGRKTQRRGHGRKAAGRFMNVATAADIPAFERMLKKGPIVVGMFYLSWCGHCKKAEPSFKEVASKNYPGVSFAMVNSDLKDKTTLRSVEVNGVPDFFVSVPNKGPNANTTIKPEMSYDRPSIERLATVASNAATMGSADPTSLTQSLNAKAGPPPFLAINKPSVKSNSLNVQPPSFRNLGSEEEKEEPINAVSQESTDEEEEGEDELMVPSYESSINMRQSINANKGRNSLVKPAASFAGEEPTAATTLSITSPIEAVSSITSVLPESTLRAAAREETLREKERAEGRNFSMIGGASPKKEKPMTLQTDKIPVTLVTNDGSKHAYQIRKSYGSGESKTVKYVYEAKFTKMENGKKKTVSKVEGKTQDDLISKIRDLKAQGFVEL